MMVAELFAYYALAPTSNTEIILQGFFGNSEEFA